MSDRVCRVVLVASFLLAGTGVTVAFAQATSVHTVGSGVSAPTVVTRVEATYLPEARAAGVRGWVTLGVVVSAAGSVADVGIAESCLGIWEQGPTGSDRSRCRSASDYTLVNGRYAANGADASRGLDQASVDAVRKWVFRPGMKDGQPVAVRVMIRLSFDPRTKS